MMQVTQWLQEGVAHHAAGRMQEAEALYRQAVAFEPTNTDALYLLGRLLLETGAMEEGLRLMQRATMLGPSLWQAHYALGLTLSRKGDMVEAVESLTQAVRVNPDFAEAHMELGCALLALHRNAEAIESFQRTFALRPDYFQALNNLSLALYAQNRLEEALVSLRQATEVNPDSVDVWTNFAYMLQAAGQAEEASRACYQAIAIAPDDAKAHYWRGKIQLRAGNFAEGWPEHEWWEMTSEHTPRAFEPPRWGGEPMPDKTLLVYADKGFGDTIQFARYLPLVKARSQAQLLFECQPELVSLLSGIPGQDAILARAADHAPPKLPYDARIGLMSLPFLLETQLETIPADIPYLTVPADTRLRWQTRIGAQTSSPGSLSHAAGEGENPHPPTPSPGAAGEGENPHPPTPSPDAAGEGEKRNNFTVGLIWAGRPGHGDDHNRSVALADFAPLAAVPGVQFFSLQKGERAAQAAHPPPGLNLIDLSADLHDFADTAAAMLALDLIISVDTSAAHLAGALGRPVWTLLPFMPDWRWMLYREDSPWYPTMRLFRQPHPGGWQSVFERAVTELRQTKTIYDFNQGFEHSNSPVTGSVEPLVRPAARRSAL